MTFTQNGFSARILADSVSPAGVRLTTIEATFPRMILAEVNTHRILSKNSASSRAIPVARQIRKILDFPFVPSKIGTDKAGMQASRFLEAEDLIAAQALVINKRDRALVGALEDLVGPEYVREAFGINLSDILMNGFDESRGDLDVLNDILAYHAFHAKAERTDPNYVLPDGFLNLHKQTLNRYLEPFMWHTAVISGTDWGNFFALRISEHAQPEIDLIARLIKDAMNASVPVELVSGEWHLPFVTDEEKAQINETNIEDWKMISSGRTARVSYETHAGVRDLEKDINLSSGLIEDGHMSPFEHIATPVEETEERDLGNFRGWLQMRKEVPFESNFALKA